VVVIGAMGFVAGASPRCTTYSTYLSRVSVRPLLCNPCRCDDTVAYPHTRPRCRESPCDRDASLGSTSFASLAACCCKVVTGIMVNIYIYISDEDDVSLGLHLATPGQTHTHILPRHGPAFALLARLSAPASSKYLPEVGTL
jgi:hypothetical protein